MREKIGTSAAKIKERQAAAAAPPPSQQAVADVTPSKESKEKKKQAGPRIAGPNIAGGVAQGAMYSNLAAPFSAAAMDVAGGLQGLTSTGSRHEMARDMRTGIAQRHEIVRQGDVAMRAAQLRRSQTPREDTVQVRPGRRSYLHE
jgi:hypothetical protein